MKRQAHEIINAHGGEATKYDIITQPGVGKYIGFQINREEGSEDTWLGVVGMCSFGNEPKGLFHVSAGGVGAAARELFKCAEILHSEDGQLYRGKDPLPQTEQELAASIGLQRYHRESGGK